MTVYARAGPDGVHEATASRGQPCPTPVAMLDKEQKTCHTSALPSRCGPALAMPGPHHATTGPALRLGVSICAPLWGRGPWGRGSLRLRESSHCDTSGMIADLVYHVL